MWGTEGDNGWFVGNVTVSWTVTDEESDAVTTGCDTIVISADTAGTLLTCEATSDGGDASESVTVKRDATPPDIGYTGNAGTYTVDQAIAITCAASDALSGLASTTCADITGPAYTWGGGSFDYSATATDEAGNESSASTSFTVRVTLDGLYRRSGNAARSRRPALIRGGGRGVVLPFRPPRAPPLYFRYDASSTTRSPGTGGNRRSLVRNDSRTLAGFSKQRQDKRAGIVDALR